eukprot:TRINITY_DN6372_c0_g1_i1.p1 TRINITY_DN6372_c0_g1~~TRINITY_DN6372_c0_g1_i1.p1  ORF type:complete len:619 (+),score=90.79 TRINITY_DN6372_c0_g1_i1:37-1893(+)
MVLNMQRRFLPVFIFYFSITLFLSHSSSSTVSPLKLSASLSRQPRFPSIWSTLRIKDDNSQAPETVTFNRQRQVVRFHQQSPEERIILLYLDKQKYFSFGPSSHSNCSLLPSQPLPVFLESPSLFTNISFNKYSLFKDILSAHWGDENGMVEYWEGVERANPLKLRIKDDHYEYLDTIVNDIDNSKFALPIGSSCPGEAISTPSAPKFPSIWSTTRVGDGEELSMRFDWSKQKVFVLEQKNGASSAFSCDYLSNKYLELSSQTNTKVGCRSVPASSCSDLVWETKEALSGLSFGGIINEGESLLYKWTDVNHNLVYLDDAFTRLPVKMIRAGKTFSYTNSQLLPINSAYFTFSEDVGCNGSSLAIRKPHFPRKWTALVQKNVKGVQELSARVFFDWNRMIFKFVYSNFEILQEVIFLNKNRTYILQRDKDKDSTDCFSKQETTKPFPLSLLNPSSITFLGNSLVNGSLTSTWSIPFGDLNSHERFTSAGVMENLINIDFDYFEGFPKRVRFQNEQEWIITDFSTVFDASVFWVPLQVSCGFGENVTKIVPLRILEMHGLPPILVAVISTCAWMFGVFLVVFFIVTRNMYTTFRASDQSSLTSYHRHRQHHHNLLPSDQ